MRMMEAETIWETLQNNSTITQLIVRQDVTEGIRELG
jgi:hypothetical protein